MIVQFDPWIRLQLAYQLQGASPGSSSSSSGVTPDGGLVGLQMALMATPQALARGTVYADLPQPIFPGYATQDLVWGTGHPNSDGSQRVNAGILNWQMSDNTVPSSIYGYFIFKPGATPVAYWGEVFATPIFLANAYDLFQLSAEWAVNANSPAAATIIA